jgi:hypothetical protein
VYGLVRAHRQRLADRLGRPLRAHRQDGDLAAVGLLEPERLLHRVLVDLVHHRVDRLAVQRVVRLGQPALRPGVGHLLDQYDDVHVLGPPPPP